MDANLANTVALALVRAIHVPSASASVLGAAPRGASSMPPIAELAAPPVRAPRAPPAEPTGRSAGSESAAFVSGTLDMVAWAQTRADQLVERPENRDTVSLD